MAKGKMVVVIEDADHNVSEPALRGLREGGYEIMVLRTVMEAMKVLPPLGRRQIAAVLTDLYLKEPPLDDWVRGAKADAKRELAAGSSFAVRAGNKCIPVAILTSESHGRNPFLFTFGPAYRTHALYLDPAWIIVLEADYCCVRGLRFVPALKGLRIKGFTQPFDGICRVEELPGTDPLWLAFMKRLRSCLLRWRCTRWLAVLLTRRPAWVRPSVHMERLLKRSATARWIANYFRLHRLVRRIARYAVFNPSLYETDRETAYLGTFRVDQTLPIKDWGKALEERMRTPVPTGKSALCESVDLDSEEDGK